MSAYLGFLVNNINVWIIRDSAMWKKGNKRYEKTVPKANL